MILIKKTKDFTCMLGVGWVKVGSSHAAVLFSFHFVHLISSILLYSAKKQMSGIPSEVTRIVPWWCKGVLVVSLTLHALLRIKIEQLHFLVLHYILLFLFISSLTVNSKLV